MTNEVLPPSTNILFQVLVPLLDSHLTNGLSFLWKLARATFSAKTHEGMYEVLDYQVTLDLCEPTGRKAMYIKKETVRFLQDNVIAYQDQAWGDGDIFAEYQCSPGVPVDRYRDGYRYRILISLRETKHRGDIETFHIQRTITDGFVQPHEDLQTRVDHHMRKLSISAIFPADRLPTKLTLVEQNAARTMQLGPEHIVTLPDHRVQVVWHTTRPRLFESYILHWTW